MSRSRLLRARPNPTYACRMKNPAISSQSIGCKCSRCSQWGLAHRLTPGYVSPRADRHDCGSNSEPRSQPREEVAFRGWNEERTLLIDIAPGLILFIEDIVDLDEQVDSGPTNCFLKFH